MTPVLWAIGTAAHAFGFDDVAREAERLAQRPHVAVPVDERLAALSYDDYRSIRFRPERAHWADARTNFQLQFFPRGRGQTRELELFEIADGQVRALTVGADKFRNDARNGLEPPAGAAGWRLHYPLNKPGVMDEVVVFLGSSYFRVLGAGLHYGLSARGLAVDTTGASGGEEFPVFKRFWIERPAPEARELRVYALLDSPRVAGAYAFTIRPGGTTTVDVRARVTLRAPVAMLGFAPLTSMFLFGENQRPADDYRPEVHDSDGLQVHTGDGEWIWRPLLNPPGVFVTSFSMQGPRGFGLMQRDRNFARYEDLEARYENRPSAWVEPLGDWGRGRVELLQYNAPDETHDNVGAFWVPATLPAPGVPMELSWRLHVGGAGLFEPPGAWVVQSRRGHGFRESPIAAQFHQYHIDFAGPALAGLAPDAVQAMASAGPNVRGLRVIAQPNTVAGGWRVTLDFERLDAKAPAELRVFLKTAADGRDRVLSETWSFALPAEN